MSSARAAGKRAAAPPAAAASARGSSPALAGLALVALTIVAYLPALHGGFLWDDDRNVTADPTLRSLGGLLRIWTDPFANQQFYPLTHTMFWLEFHAWGLHTFGYHAVNVLLHAVSALLMWALLRRLAAPAAWLAAALFALHPVHVESVAWITELKNCLSGCFALGAALAYASDLEPGIAHEPPRARRRWLTTCTLYLGALLSKSAAAPLPVALLLLRWWKRGRLAWRDVAEMLPLVALGLAMAAATAWLEQHHVGAAGGAWELSFAGKLIVAGRAFWFYLGKLVWPVHLSFVYSRWNVDARALLQWAPAALAALAFAALWATRGRIGRAPFAGLAIFAVMLSPALGFFSVFYSRYAYVADHFQYLASLGALALLAVGVMRASAWLAGRVRLDRAFVRAALGVTLVATLGLLTWRQAANYRDAETLWRATISTVPSAWLARNQLASILLGRGDFAGAEAESRTVLASHAEDPLAHDNLGIALAGLGDLDGALREHRAALALEPREPGIRANLALSLARTGRIDEALAQCDSALALEPGNPDALTTRGTIALGLGRWDAAAADLRASLASRPDQPDALSGLALAAARLGRYDESIAALREVVRLEPNSGQAHGQLAWVLHLSGDDARAAEELRECRRLGAEPPPGLESALQSRRP